jgi:murein DD-endopeptidase MepM/ murein hydrolase activator NlpD
MSTEKARGGKFFRKMKDKYRLVVLNDQTFEERASIRLSRFNVYVLVGSLLFVLSVFIFVIIAFTPIKQYLPGYGDIGMRRSLVQLQIDADSLENMVRQQELWITNARKVLAGEDTVIVDTTGIGSTSSQYDSIKLDELPTADKLLREEMEKEDDYALMFEPEDDKKTVSLSNLKLFPPVLGLVSASFDPLKSHFGTDIVAKEKESIKSVLDGTVIMADWTVETGYVIAIQHEYDLISIYKHNSVLLKKVGTFVKTGEAIAIIGNSGEQTTGPHLHFELWRNGVPVNPESYIVF